MNSSIKKRHIAMICIIFVIVCAFIFILIKNQPLNKDMNNIPKIDKVDIDVKQDKSLVSNSTIYIDTTMGETITNLIPLFFLLGIILAAIGGIYPLFKKLDGS